MAQSYRVVQRGPIRKNQLSLVIAAMVLFVYGPLNLNLFTFTSRRSGGSPQSWSYSQIAESAVRSRDGRIDYVSLQVGPSQRAAVFHVLEGRRLNAVILMFSGCGVAAEQWAIRNDLIALLTAAGRMAALPIVLQSIRDPKCGESANVRNGSSGTWIRAIQLLQRYTGTAGVPVIAIGFGPEGEHDAVRFSVTQKVLHPRSQRSPAVTLLRGRGGIPDDIRAATASGVRVIRPASQKYDSSTFGGIDKRRISIDEIKIEVPGGIVWNKAISAHLSKNDTVAFERSMHTAMRALTNLDRTT